MQKGIHAPFIPCDVTDIAGKKFLNPRLLLCNPFPPLLQQMKPGLPQAAVHHILYMTVHKQRSLFFLLQTFSSFPRSRCHMYPYHNFKLLVYILQHDAALMNPRRNPAAVNMEQNLCLVVLEILRI